jgi:hypothetical protein
MRTIGAAETSPLPPLREQTRKAEKRSPSPRYLQAQPTNELISMG